MQQTRRYDTNVHEESPDSSRFRSSRDETRRTPSSSSSSDRTTSSVDDGEHHGKWTSTATVDEAQLAQQQRESSSKTSSDWNITTSAPRTSSSSDYSRSRDYDSRDYNRVPSSSSSWSSRDTSRDYSRDTSRDYSRDPRDYSRDYSVRSDRDSYYGNGDNFSSSYSTGYVSQPRPSTYSTYHVPSSSDYSTPSWTSRDTSSSYSQPSTWTQSSVSHPSNNWNADSIWDTTPTFGTQWRESHPQWSEPHSQWKHAHLPNHVGAHHPFHHPLQYHQPQRELAYNHNTTFLAGLPHYNPFTTQQHSYPQHQQQWDRSVSSSSSSSRREKQLKTDLYSTEHDYIIELNLPGYSRDHIDVKLFGNELVISAKAPSTSASDSFNYHIRERRFREVTRRVALPSKVNGRGITAVLSNGILKVTVPHTSL